MENVMKNKSLFYLLLFFILLSFTYFFNVKIVFCASLSFEAVPIVDECLQTTIKISLSKPSKAWRKKKFVILKTFGETIKLPIAAGSNNKEYICKGVIPLKDNWRLTLSQKGRVKMFSNFDKYLDPLGDSVTMGGNDKKKKNVYRTSTPCGKSLPLIWSCEKKGGKNSLQIKGIPINKKVLIVVLDNLHNELTILHQYYGVTKKGELPPITIDNNFDYNRTPDAIKVIGVLASK